MPPAGPPAAAPGRPAFPEAPRPGPGCSASLTLSPTGRREWRSRALPPPLGQQTLVRSGLRTSHPVPGRQLTQGPGVGQRASGPALPTRKGAGRCPAQRGLRHSGGDAGLGALSGGRGLCISAAPRRDQVDAKWTPPLSEGPGLPRTRGPGGDLKPARIGAPAGATLGSLLPTTLCGHEGAKGIERPSDPSEVMQRGWGCVANRCQGAEWRRGDPAGRWASHLSLSPEAQGQGWARVRSGESGSPTGPRAWVAPGPDLPGAIRPDWTPLAREQRPRLCIHWPPVPGVPRAPPSGSAQGHPKPRDRRAPAADFALPWLNSGRQWLWRCYPGAASSKKPSPLRGLWA